MTRGAGLNPELMEQERQLGPEPSEADTPPPRRRRGAAANTQEESTEGVLVTPAMDVRASMARDVQCKHVSNMHVTLHNRHQQLGSHCIMLSGSGESPSWGTRTARCTL